MRALTGLLWVIFGLVALPVPSFSDDADRATRRAESLERRQQEKADRDARRAAAQERRDQQVEDRQARRLDERRAQQADRQARQLEQREARDARSAEARERQNAVISEQAARRQAQQDQDKARVALCERLTKYLAGIGPLPEAAKRNRQGLAAANDLPPEAWILQDALFVPEFGHSFDSLAPQDAERFRTAGNSCVSPGNGRPSTVTDPGFFGRVLTAPYTDKVRRGVAEIRVKVMSADTVRKELADLPTNEEGADRFSALAKRRQSTASYLLPSERATFERAFADAYVRVVAPLHAARLTEAAAGASGSAGIRSLAALRDKLQATAGEVRATLQLPPAFVERYAGLVDEVVLTERGRVDALGEGLEGLERGVAWRREFDRDTANLDPRLSKVRTYFEQRRTVTLAAAGPSLLSRISQASSDQELNSLTGRYVPFPADLTDDAGQAVGAALRARREALEKQAVLARNAPAIAAAAPVAPAAPAAAAAIATASPQTQAATAADGGPTEGEMYEAFKAKIDAINAEIDTQIDQCNRREYRANGGDPALAMHCLVLGASGGLSNGGQRINTTHFRLSRFKRVACEKAPGRAGYHCDFIAGIDSNMQNMPPVYARMISQGELRQGRFVKQDTGWLLLDSGQSR